MTDEGKKRSGSKTCCTPTSPPPARCPPGSNPEDAEKTFLDGVPLTECVEPVLPEGCTARNLSAVLLTVTVLVSLPRHTFFSDEAVIMLRPGLVVIVACPALSLLSFIPVRVSCFGFQTGEARRGSFPSAISLAHPEETRTDMSSQWLPGFAGIRGFCFPGRRSVFDGGGVRAHFL